MLTVRCNILLVSTAWMLIVSILIGNEPLTLLCVAVWTWIWIEWILFQFANKIDNRSVGSVFADNIAKSKHPGLKPEIMTKGAYQTFASQLACTV